MRGRRRQPLLHVAVEFGARGIDRVAGMNEPRIRREPPHQVVERLVAPHGFNERTAGRRSARQVGQLALVGFLEGDALGVGAVEIGLDRGIVKAGIKVGEIPLRQPAQRGFRPGRSAPRGPLDRGLLRHFSGIGHAWRGSSRATCGAALWRPQDGQMARRQHGPAFLRIDCCTPPIAHTARRSWRHGAA